MRILTGRLFVAVALLGLVGAACGSAQKVGSEKLLKFQEQQNAQALGRAASATPAPVNALGQNTPPPAAVKTQPPRPKTTPTYFDVSLVTNSPFYSPGNCWVMPVGITLRVTNKDMASERKGGRSFTDKQGSFNSGILKPGGQWTWVFNAPATYDIVDEKVNFASGVLHVGQGSCGK